MDRRAARADRAAMAARAGQVATGGIEAATSFVQTPSRQATADRAAGAVPAGSAGKADAGEMAPSLNSPTRSPRRSPPEPSSSTWAVAQAVLGEQGEGEQLVDREAPRAAAV